ncbi:MAG: prepilin-type N-terminal cleavage/methylation domain-containing protein [Desulfurobacteriaceae bacterium]
MRREGFSILEVVISMAILLIVFLGIVPMLFLSKKVQVVSRERQKAAILGETLINKLASLSFNDTCLENGTVESCKNSDCCFELKGNNEISYSVMQLDNNTKIIKVEVDYGNNFKLEFERIKGNL